MNDRVNTLLKILDEIYPEKISFITENNPWRFLVTVMLSASTTDKQAIKVAAELFKRFPEPSDFAGAEIHEIETIIKPAGLYRTKAPRIKEVSSYIARNGLPHTEEELMNLPGIGEKTAACYLEHVLSLPAVIADTHFVQSVKQDLSVLNVLLKTSVLPQSAETQYLEAGVILFNKSHPSGCCPDCREFVGVFHFLVRDIQTGIYSKFRQNSGFNRKYRKVAIPRCFPRELIQTVTNGNLRCKVIIKREQDAWKQRIDRPVSGLPVILSQGFSPAEPGGFIKC